MHFDKEQTTSGSCWPGLYMRRRGQQVILVSSGAIALGRRQLGLDKGVLSLDAEAKTFRYLDEDEIAKQRAAAKAKEKGKAKK